jgi:hypothetical protein
VSHDDRLEHLYRLLNARTKQDPLGSGRRVPLNANFAPNVAAIQAEIEKLEERLTAIALLEAK